MINFSTLKKLLTIENQLLKFKNQQIKHLV